MEQYERFNKAYPLLFSDYPYCGFELPDIWEDAVNRACLKIEALLTSPTQCIVAQVKVKFGGLRFYVDIDYEVLDPDVVEQIEQIISKVEGACFCQDFLY